MKTIGVVSIIFCMLMMACVSKKEGNRSIINIDLKKMSKSIVLDSVGSIVLETNDDALIGRVDKVLVVRDKVYVLDSEMTKALFVFNIKGKFLYKIRRVGKGEGEYLAPDDFTVNEDSGEVYILDIDQKKIMAYVDGDYKREKRLDEDLAGIQSVDNKIIGFNDNCFRKNSCFRFFVMNNYLKILNKRQKIAFRSETISWQLEMAMFKHDNIVYFTEPFLFGIKGLDSNLNEVEHLEIDFGTASIDEKTKEQPRDKFLKYLNETSKAFLVDNFMMNKDVVFFTFFYKSFLHFTFCKKQDYGKIKIAPALTLCNNSRVSPCYMDSQNLYSLVYPDAIKQDDRLALGLNKIKESDNPILIVSPTKHIIGHENNN